MYTWALIVLNLGGYHPRKKLESVKKWRFFGAKYLLDAIEAQVKKKTLDSMKRHI